MPRTKSGEKISWDQFFKRWKEGINGITPLQKLKAQLNGINIQLIGLLIGFTISVMNYQKLWWVGIILFGGIILAGIQKLGIKQQVNKLSKFESTTEEKSLEEIFEEGGKD